MKRTREFWAAALVVLFAATYANATSIYSWSNGEVLTATQLNANFAHIHNSMVGGHGARLVDSDVSTLAAISTNKLAARYFIPTVWAKVGAGATACAADPCTVEDSSGTVTVARAGNGSYTATFPAQSDAVFAVVVQANSPVSVLCRGIAATTTTASIVCTETVDDVTDTNAATDAAFSFLVFDT